MSNGVANGRARVSWRGHRVLVACATAVLALEVAGVRADPRSPAAAEPGRAAASPQPVPVPASPAERLQVLRTLVVADGDIVAGATCIGCGVVVRGRVLGDTIAILGGVVVQGASGSGPADDVLALGGSVHLGAAARVPASIVSLGGPVRIDAGATASYDVDSLPWLHVPGQRQLFLEGAASLFGFVLAVALLGAALVRAEGIAARDAALARAPLSRGLLGFALVCTLGCVMANGERLGRFEDFAQAGLGLGLFAAMVLGSTGVASLVGRALAGAAGRRLEPGWASVALGAVALALLCLVPLVGAGVAVGALFLACGGAFARRVTLTASSRDEGCR